MCISMKAEEMKLLGQTEQGILKSHAHWSDSELKLGILGSGNYGRALASRCKQAGLPYLLGSRRASYNKPAQMTTTYEYVVEECEIIFFAIPRHAYDSTIARLQVKLKDKIIVDISNINCLSDPSNALYLQSVLPQSHIVKALNTVSAYSLECDAYGATRDTYVCADRKECREKVAQAIRELGLNPVDRGRLNSAVFIEQLPHRFFEGWGTAFKINGLVGMLAIFYIYLRFFWANSTDVSKNLHYLSLYLGNKTIGWMALWSLSFAYLPGVISGYIQLAWGTKYKSFPQWLDTWMKCRKQLGLIALALTSIHIVLSGFLTSGHMLKVMSTYQEYTIYSDNFNSTATETVIKVPKGYRWNAEISLLLGAIAMTLMAIAGVTSIPSVGASLSWREWNFVQRGIGFSSLVFTFIHVIILIYELWHPNGDKNWAPHWRKNMPPGSWVMPVIPAFVIVFKVPLLLPGIMGYLDRIREGRVDKVRDREEKMRQKIDRETIL